jgi:peptidoglycan/LPS O-acetylase OafA/YrhL
MTQNSVFQFAIGNGTHGVTVFFVISGYLITTLLLREFDQTGRISLRRFYFRRTMRIFPPFYCLLGVMAVLWTTHIIPEDLRSYLASMTYTWALYPSAHGYFIFHTWSLSIEELFYLLWPFLFVLLHRKKMLVAASSIIILLMPVTRILFYYVFPTLRGHEFYMFQGWIDTMMVGCLLALLKQRRTCKKWQQKLLNGWTASALVTIAFYILPEISALLPKKLAGGVGLAIAPTITAFCIGFLLLYCVDHGNNRILRLLNMRLIRHIGILSYSLYLWQQLFLSQERPLLPYGYLFLVFAAECSFWFVEKPSLRFRSRIETRWFPARPSAQP